MSIHPIIKMGHPTLRQVAKPVAPADIDTPEMNALIADMIETLHDAGGIGFLAADQSTAATCHHRSLRRSQPLWRD